jgi:hypothetical protein
MRVILPSPHDFDPAIESEGRIEIHGREYGYVELTTTEQLLALVRAYQSANTEDEYLRLEVSAIPEGLSLEWVYCGC